MKTLSKRRNLTAVVAAVAFLLTMVCSRPLATGAAQSEQAERVLEDKIPVHLPIKVKVKNLDKEHWARDLEVEVKNTGSKPIYLVDFFILMPDTKGPSGNPIGFPFIYGRHELVDIDVRATSDDVPLNPGESHTFKISEREVMVWEKELTNPDGRKPKKFRVMFSVLNFGDGTGFLGTDGAPIPNRRASKTQCAPRASTATAGAANSPPANFPGSASHLPVSFLPANFFAGKAYVVGPTPASLQIDQSCCTGTSCFYEKLVPDGYDCQCGKADWVETTSCRDTTGRCGRGANWDRVCYDPTGQYEYHCPVFYISPCGSIDTE